MKEEIKLENKKKSLDVKVSSDLIEGERTIVAVVTSSNFDRDNERVDVYSLRLPLKKGGYALVRNLVGDEEIDIPFLINHSFDVEDVIGSVRKAYLSEAGELVFELGISNRSKAQDLMTLIDEGHLDNAFSITMSDYAYSDSTISDAEVIEVSLVFRGSNKDARVLAVKSLLKGNVVEDEKIKTLDTEVEAPTEAPEEVTDEKVAEEEVKEVVETEDVKTEVEETISEEVDSASEELPNKEEGEKEMANKEIAVKQVKEPVTETEVIDKKVKLSASEQKALFVKQFMAYKDGDRNTLATLNKKAMESEGISKAIGYSDGSSIYQTAVVSSDILEEYTNIGRVGSLVTKINISGAETWKRLVQTSGNGFQPVGIEEVKQEDKPIWTHISVEPKEHAMIIAWYDAVAKRTPLAVYQSIVKYIAKEYAKLEDKIILSFAGATTTGGDTFVATGLEPILRTANRTVTLSSYDAGDVIEAFGEAFGKIESDETLTAVCNRTTWASLATSVDKNDRPIFTTVGESVSIGALGTFKVSISQEVTDGSVIFGAFGDYELVTNGGLETLFSQHASVGSLNLFTSDASALRAGVDIAGKPTLTNSFVVIDHATIS